MKENVLWRLKLIVVWLQLLFKKKRTHSVIGEPCDFAGVDEEMGGRVKSINSNLLRLTSVTPENY